MLLQEEVEREYNKNVHCRYAQGLKYCKSCSKWIRPRDVVYDSKKKHAKCPLCNGRLKTRPRDAKGKERIAKITGIEVKRY